MCLGVRPCAAPILNSSRHCICSLPVTRLLHACFQFPSETSLVLRISIPDPLLRAPFPPSLSSPLFFSNSFSLRVSTFFWHPLSSVLRLFRQNNSLVSAQRCYRYIFRDMKIRSTIVYHAKDPPMKQMRVMVKIWYILYNVNACAQCVHILLIFFMQLN